MQHLAPEQVLEVKEINRIINIAIQDPQNGINRLCRFRHILQRYQEWPQLLDVHIESFVEPLISKIASVIKACKCVSSPTPSFTIISPSDFQAIQVAAAFLHLITSVRGYKTVSRFFPHAPSDLESIIIGLLQCHVIDNQLTLTVRDQATTNGIASSLDGLLLCDMSQLMLQQLVLSLYGRLDTGDGSNDMLLWRLQYILLQWLSILVIIPFNLHTVDTLGVIHQQQYPHNPPHAPATIQSPPSGESDRSSLPAVVRMTESLCTQLLTKQGSAREIASVVLGKLLTRSDMGDELRWFVAWSKQLFEAHAGVEDQNQTSMAFLVHGLTSSLACVFKIADRAVLGDTLQQMWLLVDDLQSVQAVKDSAQTRKLVMKLTGRLALLSLPPTQPTTLLPNAFPQQNKNMLDTLASHTSSTNPQNPTAPPHQPNPPNDTNPPPTNPVTLPSAPVPSTNASVEQFGAEHPDGSPDEEDEEEVPEVVEGCVGVLLNGVWDSDTVVRWSAAKGIGRVCSRLSAGLCQHVVETICDEVGKWIEVEYDSGVHGACLSIAELAVRGLISTAQLTTLLPLIQSALQFDARRGHNSVGVHVRDAACYVCWAVARAYPPSTVQSFIKSMAASVVCVACYDREVNCRRAASAAFQEAIGRAGYVPDGLSVMTAADFFMVGTRSSAFLNVGPIVASHAQYTIPMATFLIQKQAIHWEPQLRELAAQALSALVPLAPHWFCTNGVQMLITQALNKRLGASGRHGSLLGLSAVVAVLMPQDPSRYQDAGCGLESSGEGGAVHLEFDQHGTNSMVHTSTGAVRVRIPEDIQVQLANMCTLLLGDNSLRGAGGIFIQTALCRLLATLGYCRIPVTQAQFSCIVQIINSGLRHGVVDLQLASAQALWHVTRCYTGESDDGLPVVNSSKGKEQFTDNYLAQITHHQVDCRRGAIMAIGVMPPKLLGDDTHKVIAQLTSAMQDIGVDYPSAECRKEAVKSITSLCRNIVQNALNTNDAQAPQARLDSAQLLRGPGLQAMCIGLRDYAVDKRGDVGSWIRESCIVGSVQIVKDLLRLTDYEPSHGKGGGQATGVLVSHDAGVDGLNEDLAGRDFTKRGGAVQKGGVAGGEVGVVVGGEKWTACYEELRKQWFSSEEGVGVLRRIVGLMAQQTVEKIGKMRQLAAQAIKELLELEQVQQALPCSTALSQTYASIPSQFFVSPDSITSSAAILSSAPYYCSVLAGLATSLGGFDPSLRDAAEFYLNDFALGYVSVQYWNEIVGSIVEDVKSGYSTYGTVQAGGPPPTAPESVPGGTFDRLLLGEGGGAEEIPKVMLVLAGLAGVWQQNQKSIRLSVPVLTLVAVVFGNGDGDCLLQLAPQMSPHVASDAATALLTWLLHLVRIEGRACTSIQTLLLVADCLCHLSFTSVRGTGGTWQTVARADAIEALMVLLVNRFPRVRAHAAQALLHTLAPYAQTSLKLYRDEPAASARPSAEGGSLGDNAQSKPGHELRSWLVSAGTVDKVVNIVLHTWWDGSNQEDIKQSQKDIIAELNLQPPKVKKVTRKKAAKVARPVSFPVPTGSYGSMLTDFARGM